MIRVNELMSSKDRFPRVIRWHFCPISVCTCSQGMKKSQLTVGHIRLSATALEIEEKHHHSIKMKDILPFELCTETTLYPTFTSGPNVFVFGKEGKDSKDSTAR
ncbi:hypothetical protein CEXT_266391 [Caerostris extrusa]|uniref:Uncharacterized protein n=1 Tax=Caerostris extrusa TaxID=172846 RepID=A0AAV4X2I5_CAEEX|nr:hypothetical protein CEXT_266391 [Caerostris extrusa]